VSRGATYISQANFIRDFFAHRGLSDLRNVPCFPRARPGRRLHRRGRRARASGRSSLSEALCPGSRWIRGNDYRCPSTKRTSACQAGVVKHECGRTVLKIASGYRCDSISEKGVSSGCVLRGATGAERVSCRIRSNMPELYGHRVTVGLDGYVEMLVVGPVNGTSRSEHIQDLGAWMVYGCRVASNSTIIRVRTCHKCPKCFNLTHGASGRGRFRLFVIGLDGLGLALKMLRIRLKGSEPLIRLGYNGTLSCLVPWTGSILGI
jgi:hypothetical protein